MPSRRFFALLSFLKVFLSALPIAFVVAACETSAPRTFVEMNFELAETLDHPLRAPFPSEHRRADDSLSPFRASQLGSSLSRSVESQVRTRTNFAQSGAVYFGLSDRLNPASLPSVQDSVTNASDVFLVRLENQDGTLPRSPAAVSFVAEARPLARTNTLVVAPYPGFPLEPNADYAAVVRTNVRDARGNELLPIASSEDELNAFFARLKEPARASYQAAMLALASSEGKSLVDFAKSVAGIAVFRTDDAPSGQERDVAQARQDFDVETQTALRLVDQNEVYCMWEGVLSIPSFQEGEPPFASTGGDFARDANHRLRSVRRENARVRITLPKRSGGPASNELQPMVFFIRTGGGGDNPLVDRGPATVPASSTNGKGPVLEISRAGFAAITVDGPHGGLRNVSQGDEQFTVFNPLNPAALSANLRASALELSLVADWLELQSLDLQSTDASSCDPRQTIRFDTSRMPLFGHSMGASIAPLAAAIDERFSALVLSGAGASLARNILYKEKPIPVRGASAALLNYPTTLEEFDPVVQLFQWAVEDSDALIYAPLLATRSNFHALVFQGVIDHYIPDRVANPLILALGLDRIENDFDNLFDEPLAPLLALRGASTVRSPLSQNRGSSTRGLYPVREDGILDGHESFFQSADARRVFECFLKSLMSSKQTGSPVQIDLNCSP